MRTLPREIKAILDYTTIVNILRQVFNSSKFGATKVKDQLRKCKEKISNTFLEEEKLAKNSVAITEQMTHFNFL
jgi:predicted PP-loop superfamily ATPase